MLSSEPIREDASSLQDTARKDEWKSAERLSVTGGAGGLLKRGCPRRIKEERVFMGQERP